MTCLTVRERRSKTSGLLLAAALSCCAAAMLWPSFAGAWQAGGDGWQVNLAGHLLSTQLAGVTPASGAVPRSDLGLAVVRARPVLEVRLGDVLRLEGAWDGLALLGKGSLGQGLALAPANPLRLGDVGEELYAGETFDLQSNLDRALVVVRIGPLGIQLGRQAIGYGAARLLPSADLFGTFSPGAIATEFKRGVDALRVSLPIGDAIEVEAIAVAHRGAVSGGTLGGGEPADTGWRDGLYLLRIGVAHLGWLDASVLAGITYRRPTLAWAASGDLGDTGWYLEGSVRAAASSETASPTPIDPALPTSPDLAVQTRASLGLSRSWLSQTQLLCEVSWQSFGAEDPSAFARAAQALPSRVGEAFLLGRWHAAAAISQQVLDLHSLQLATIANLDDGSALLMPGGVLSISDEVTLALGLLVPVGKRPTTQILGLALPRSELGGAPILGYVDVRAGL